MHDQAQAAALGELTRFRQEFYTSLTARSDVLFELTDAVLYADGPVKTLVDLTLVAEHRRGHGAMYDGLNHGRVEPDRIRRTLASLPLPKATDGRIVLAVDVSPWLRSDAPTSAERRFCHVYGRGKGQAQLIPGWLYSFVAALEPGRTSWTALLDAVRLGPTDDATAVTADQLRAVVARLTAAEHWREGDTDILIVTDAGYDITRLAFVLADLPVQLVGRIRSDRVPRLPKPPRSPGATGRPLKHGPEFALDKPATWPEPAHTTTTDTTRYGIATATSWDRLHPRLTHRGCWIDHQGELPVIEGTLIRLHVERLPGDRDPKPVWLWSSTTGATAADVDRWWQSFLRRFDLEHTFRLLTQTLGWTAPKIRTPQAADRWTWIVIAAHTQLRLARPLAEDLRRPWEQPAPPSADPDPSPPRVPERPREDRPPGQRTETHPSRTRTPTRLQEHKVSTALRRRKDRQTRPHPDYPPTTQRLKIKLSTLMMTSGPCRAHTHTRVLSQVIAHSSRPCRGPGRAPGTAIA